MHENNPSLTILKAASKAIESVWSRPDLASIDFLSLERLSTEQNLSIATLLRQALNLDSSQASNGALGSLMHLNTLNERVRKMAAQIEEQPELVSSIPFIIPGFNRLVRDTLLSLQFVTQVFPDLQTHPE